MANLLVAAVVNSRSKRKYEEFSSAMAQVWLVLDEARMVVEKLDPMAIPHGYRVSSQEQLLEQAIRAQRTLEALESKARRYQAQLVSIEWRL